MSLIKSVTFISNKNENSFMKAIDEEIQRLQNMNCKVEIQYSTTHAGNGFVEYSALIIGRA